MITALPLAYLTNLLRDAGVIELRGHLRNGQWCSGLYKDPQAALREAQALGEAGANVYTTLNRPLPAVSYRARDAMRSHALKDADIAHRVRLPFDFDPVRPVNAASNANELAYALEARDRVATALASLGWPEPARGMSGNGGHLLYRCCIEETPELREQVSTIYAGLFEDFTGGEVVFDRSVKNSARIWRLYGTVNRKGTSSVDRPHRVATIAVPREWRALDPRQVDRLANAYAKRNERSAPPTSSKPAVALPARSDGSRGDLRSLDVVSWFETHEAYRRAMSGGKHAVRCPWESEHSTKGAELDSSTVVWEAHDTAWPSFHCSHAHCGHRTIRDVLALWGDADAFCTGTWQPAKRRRS
jgi:hypothetical protein